MTDTQPEPLCARCGEVTHLLCCPHCLGNSETGEGPINWEVYNRMAESVSKKEEA